MYSGTTLRNASGRLIGTHQKIDRVARRALEQLAPDSSFPLIRQILHFEGKNGPDGIKRKSPARDEPWHYYNPDDPTDDVLTQMISLHSKNLSEALKTDSKEKAAFEAAWLAHAIVDGLTPAHHYPLEDKLVEMRGEGIETRTSYKDKLIIRGPGDSRMKILAKNWEFWGAKGVMTSHLLFEMGLATLVAPLPLRAGHPSVDDIQQFKQLGLVEFFKQTAQQIHALNMYHRFIEKGWTGRLAREGREVLIPLIIRVVTMAWLEALQKSRRR